MTISSEINSIQYAGNGTTVAFAFPYLFYSSADLLVLRVAADGTVSTLVLNVDYTVDGAGAAIGGTVTATVAPASGTTLTITRSPAAIQESHYVSTQPFPSATVERGYDYLTMLYQRVLQRVKAAIHYPDGETNTDATLASVSTRKGTYLFFDAVTGAISYAVNLAVQTLTQAVFNAFYFLTDDHKRTAAELAAGVTPTNYAYPQGNFFRYGAAGNGSTDDSTAIGKAFLVGGTVTCPTGFTFKATQLTMGVANTTLVLEAGSTISQITETNKLITVSGLNCSIVGTGRLLSPAVFDGTNTPATYAVVWVTANGFYGEGITLENVPKYGYFFEDATLWRLTGIRINGNFPYASWTGTNTGHAGIGANCPTAATVGDQVAGVLVGSFIQRCVQGFLIGNTGSAANEAGFTASGNTFSECWNHGVYWDSIMQGACITGNTFNSCQNPITCGGTAPVVTGNVLYSPQPSNSNGYCILLIRESTGAVVVGNSLYGLGAAIFLQSESDSITDTVNYAVVADNVIYRTGTSGQAGSAIRLGNFCETCQYNVIENNTIYGNGFTAGVGAIQLEMKATFKGSRNIVRNNRLILNDQVNGIQITDHNDTIVEHNTVTMTYNTGSAQTVVMLYFITSTNCEGRGNRLYYTTGGTNVNIRGVQTDVNCTGLKFTDNRFFLTSGSLASADPVGFLGTFYFARNQISGAADMSGTFQWNTTTASSTVNNANVTANSRVTVVPTDANAGIVIQTKGYYVTCGAGSFVIHTGDGTNTAANSQWLYSIE